MNKRILVAGIVGLMIGAVLVSVVPQLSVRIAQFMKNPIVGVSSTILAAIAGLIIGALSGRIKEWLQDSSRRVSLQLALVLFVCGIFVVWGAAIVAVAQFTSNPSANSGTPTTATDDSSFLFDLSLEDDDAVEPMQTIQKGWRVYNKGNTTWKNIEVRRLPGFAMGPDGFHLNEEVLAGMDYSIFAPPFSAPPTSGCYRSRYQLFNSDTQSFFGEKLSMLLVVGPSGKKIDYMLVIDDFNVREGTVMGPGQEFSKGWIIHNCGDNPWINYKAKRVSGEFGPDLIDVPIVAPHQDVLLRTPMRAPQIMREGYTSTYMLQNANGQSFGTAFAVQIKVR